MYVSHHNCPAKALLPNRLIDLFRFQSFLYGLLVIEFKKFFAIAVRLVVNCTLLV